MRVLLVKTSSLGDVIHTLPALTDAARAIPGICFDWVVEEGFAEIPAWHPTLEFAPFATGPGGKGLLAPAPQGHRDHLAHRRVPGGNLGEAFFHHPVELNAGDRPRGIGQCRQGMDHVAQG